MSFVSSPFLVRLQEIKLWQGNYDNLLLKNRSQNLTDCSDSDLRGGVSPLTHSIPDQESPSSAHCDWDKKVLSPTKTFNELLEEKLAEDQPVKIPPKTRQPYLKKGSGLARYNLSPVVLISTNKKPFVSKAISHPQINSEQAKNELTPLKAPEVNIKCKASWSKITEEETKSNKQNEIKPLFENSEYIPNSENIVEKNEVSLMPPFVSAQKNNPLDQDVEECTSFEMNRSEKELCLFELLEEKLEHASFSSNNSSIRRLLSSSTPVKQKLSKKKLGKHNSEVLTRLLQNLQLISQKNFLEENVSDGPANKSDSDTDSELEGEKWSNPNSHVQSNSSFYTEFEDTLGDNTGRVSAGVNTSFVDLTESTERSGQCINCIELKNKINELEKVTPQIITEKAKLYDFAKELETKRDELRQEIQFLKKNYEKEIYDLQEELSNEKSKLAREKALADMYLKESRPSKKDRDELERLKRDLIDVKELMKMKEAKNGTTQARLRNQIKQLEKEKSELKALLENSQKENAKLSASQKVNRTSDTKMLQEINRNLHRLTEETKHISKTETVNPEDKTKKKCRRKSMGDLKEKVEQELNIQLNKTSNIASTIADQKENLFPSESYSKDFMLSDVEKQYESAFGLHNESEVSMKKMNQSKQDVSVLAEKVFADGSLEMKYTDGSTRIMSPDKKFIYVQYPNGDVKETDLNKNIQKYYFIAKDTWLTKYADGTEVVEFPTGQKETKHPDGKLEVIAADGKKLIKTPGGTEEITYPDGSRMVTTKDEKIIYLCNGQKEIHKKEYKRREYPDGTVKILYPDGTQESRYSTGRVRIKDPDGNLIVDSYLYKTT